MRKVLALICSFILCVTVCGCHQTNTADDGVFIGDIRLTETMDEAIAELADDCLNAQKYKNKVCAYVDGEPIYKYEILQQMALGKYYMRYSVLSYLENSVKSNINELSSSDLELFEMFYDMYNKDYDDTLSDTISSRIACNEGKKIGTLTEIEITAKAEEDTDSLKKFNMDYYNAVLAGRTEEEFQESQILGVTRNGYKNIYKEHVCPRANYSDMDSPDKRDEDFSEHLLTLWEAHDVKIVKLGFFAVRAKN